MGHTYYAMYQHIAFSTKQRVHVLDANVQPDLYAYMAGTINNLGCTALLVGGHTDHVHALVSTSPSVLIKELVKETKRVSSIWLKTKGEILAGFAWQSGYGVFSVSHSRLDSLKEYIANQAEHHRKMTWEEEFRVLLVKHGIEFDERYFLD